MMRALFQEQGGSFRVEILAEQPVQDFISAHASVLDSGFQHVEMSEAMRRRLTRSDYIFSGIKTFHELNEAFPSLIDENGNRKPFERFLNDVRSIDQTYNANYLRAEYNFVQASATMAAKWEQFQEDGDRYNLQYRTAGDTRVRPAHAALNGVTLPPSDSFWTEYYPPNGWNCRCTVIQVRKAKYPATPHDEAMSLGEEALGGDKKGIFRFNSGKQQKTFPDYNPYTIRRCNDCDIAQGKAPSTALNLTKPLECDLCQACQLLRSLSSKQKQNKLTQTERKQARDAANKWAEQHLQQATLPNGQISKMLNIWNNAIGKELILKKDFFGETFAKNIKSRQLAETMRIATRIEYWLPDAAYLGQEPGRDHKEPFEVFQTSVNGTEIICKAMVKPDKLLLYTMRIITKK